jgi:hypothetical protein
MVKVKVMFIIRFAVIPQVFISHMITMVIFVVLVILLFMVINMIMMIKVMVIDDIEVVFILVI